MEFELLVGFSLFVMGWATRFIRPFSKEPPFRRFANDPALERVRALVAEWSVKMDFGSEAKRHQVYALLMKEFPTYRHRDLAYMIEEILQESSS